MKILKNRYYKCRAELSVKKMSMVQIDDEMEHWVVNLWADVAALLAGNKKLI